MSIIAKSLSSINDNTNGSNAWLEAISQKNFQDKELRDVISAAGKIKSKTPAATNGSRQTAKAITKLARP